jgi:hypothetical protein
LTTDPITTSNIEGQILKFIFLLAQQPAIESSANIFIFLLVPRENSANISMKFKSRVILHPLLIERNKTRGKGKTIGQSQEQVNSIYTNLQK